MRVSHGDCGQGSCGYGILDKSKWPYWSVGALSTSNIHYGQGPVRGCGECFEVECQQSGGQFAGRCNQDSKARSVTMMISDSCPECEGDHLDIQALTFNKMAPMALGRIDIKYRRVACQVPQNLNVIVDENRGAGGWIRLQVKDAANRGSVKNVQIKGSNSNWQTLNNVWGASWETGQVPATPLDFRIQDDQGIDVTAYSVIKSNGQTGTLPTGVNFQIGTGSNQSLPSFASGSSAGPPVSAFEGPPQSGCVSAFSTDDSTSSSDGCGQSSGSPPSPSPPPPSSSGSSFKSKPSPPPPPPPPPPYNSKGRRLGSVQA
ncbi:hypothetical protein CVIRNUC_002477 [Coccomyxa viridis]|uniref:Uncharacterized protein n=1 Tax=Coccomyxa viridis TaxID=1274662 RepID=A0AAV1HYI8_9CHLO|nr:hypothetical protein CVIRNUC_002477 [Coccomyxa viridis]